MTIRLASTQKTYGEIVAENVSAEDFMQQYEGHYEWLEGNVIKMSPVTFRHDVLVNYLRQLLAAYFSIGSIEGQIVGDPFVMRLDAVESRRQPDLQVILKGNPGQLTETGMIGPADICIEIVSLGSVTTDYGEKFEEYEKGGVREYWLIDPIRKMCHFHRLNDSGLFIAQKTDDKDNYQSPLLPELHLHVPTLWQDELPDIISVVQSVQAMFNN